MSLTTPITMRAPDDFHVHFRQSPMLAPVVRETARWFARALAMPNTTPPITTPERLRSYLREIGAAVPPGIDFAPLMVFKVVPELAPADVAALGDAGAIGGKLYPQGVTTNSSDGASDIDALYPVFEAMEEADLVLEIHAEEPGIFSLDRERAFLPRIERIAARFPRLRIVIEHISSAEAVTALDSLPTTVAATVTVHHLLLTLDDVIGDELRPHHFCKPVAKRPSDREALCAAVLSGNPRVFFGSDSAPHLRGDKESDCGCAGVYTAPVAVPLLAEFFADAGLPLTEPRTRPEDGASLVDEPSLEAFVSRYGADFYRLPRNGRTITLVESETEVPGEYDGVVPFRAGTTLRYELMEESHEYG